MKGLHCCVPAFPISLFVLKKKKWTKRVAEENEDLYDTDDSLASTQGPLVAGSADNPSGTSTSTRRKKGKKSDSVFMQLVDNLSNMG